MEGQLAPNNGEEPAKIPLERTAKRKIPKDESRDRRNGSGGYERETTNAPKIHQSKRCGQVWIQGMNTSLY